MRLSVCLGGHTYSFRDVRDVMGKANEEKSGDQLCGVAAQTPQERVAARIVLSEMTVKEICEHPAVPYEQDEVTRLILDGLNRFLDEEGLSSVTELTGGIRPW